MRILGVSVRDTRPPPELVHLLLSKLLTMSLLPVLAVAIGYWIGVGAQPRPACRDGLGQERFFDGRQALIDLAGLLRIDIHAENFKTTLGKGGGDARAQLTQPANRDFLNRFHTIAPESSLEGYTVKRDDGQVCLP